MRWPGLFLTKRGHGVPADMAPWAAILSIAALFVGWEFLTHYYGHRFITANRVSFAVIVTQVGLIGSFFTWFTFIYLERISRGGASVVPGELRGETSWLRRSESLEMLVPTRVGIGRLKWVAIFAPAGLFVAWEYASHFVLHSEIASERTLYLITVVAVGLGASAFTQAFFRLLERMQRQIIQQNQELTTRTTSLEALYEIGTALSALLEVGTVKATAVGRARQLLDADTAGLALVHESTEEVGWELLAGATSDEYKRIRLQPGQGVAGKVIQSGEPVIIEDATGLQEVNPILATENLLAILAVPIRIAGKPIGALMVGHRNPYSFSLNDLKLLMSLANQVAVAINNAHLHERLGALSALEERERLAREMHDGLAQLLGHVTGRAMAAAEFLHQGNIEEAEQQLDRLRAVAQEAYVDVRQSILGLRTRPSEQQGLLEALGEFVTHMTEQEGIAIRLETQEGAEALELAPAVEVQAIRIIQEALSNVRKHSRAQEAWVKVDKNSQWITVTIQDNGQGFDITRMNGRGGHFGLQTMRERAEAVGGHLTIEAAPGKGTMVTVVLPAGTEK